MTTVLVAEKPSVARDLARIVGAEAEDGDALRGSGWVVTWLVGHVAELAEPGDVRPEWRRFCAEDLPILPVPIPWRVTERGRARFEAVRRCCRAPGVRRIIGATDAGREGELIFRVLMDLVGEVEVPVERLWVSSMTDAALEAGLRAPRPAAALAPVGRAALGRAWLDWWVGMNASRALTLQGGQPVSAGRVQTPTLAALVERDRAIADHVPSPFVQLRAELDRGCAEPWSAWVAREPQDPSQEAEGAAEPEPPAPEPREPELRRFAPEDPAIEAILRDLAEGTVYVEALRTGPEEVPPPALFDLESLQQVMCREHGWSAQETLDEAQRLYERFKLLSYPRTRSRYLTAEDADALVPVVAAVARRRGWPEPPPEGLSRWVAPEKVEDHPAIVPTGDEPSAGLPPRSALLLERVEARLIAACAGPGRIVRTEVRLRSEGGVPLRAAACRLVEPGGWAREPEGPADAGSVPAGLAEGEVVSVRGVHRVEGVEPPPPPFDDASLLGFMVEAGLGTPATRAATLETLVSRGYADRRGRADGRTSLVSTPLGRALIARCPARLRRPETTARWEADLRRIEASELELDRFVAGAQREVTALVQDILSGTEAPLQAPPRGLRLEPDHPLPDAPSPEVRRRAEAIRREGLDPQLEARLAEEAGVAVTASAWLLGRYALGPLDEPRDRPVVVLTRVDARVEDEVAQLRQLGLRASAEDRGAGLDVLYLDPGLSSTSPVEAGAVDLEPEPAPATHERLGAGTIGGEARWVSPLVHRSGLEARVRRAGGPSRILVESRADWSVALEVASAREVGRGRGWTERLGRALASEAQVWVRAASVDAAEQLADRLGGTVSHPGLGTDTRRRAQVDFLEGRARLLVTPPDELDLRRPIPGLTTLVFAPGAIPLGLDRFAAEALAPTALEHEVRVLVLLEARLEARRLDALDAGRPPPAALGMVARALGGDTSRSEAELASASGLEPTLVRRYLGLLAAVGGAVEDAGGWRAGDGRWPTRYRSWRDEGAKDERRLRYWLEGRGQPGCRLLGLLAALEWTSTEPCGQCDRCDPEGAVFRRFRPPTEGEQSMLIEALTLLRRAGALGVRDLLEGLRRPQLRGREHLAQLLDGLAGAGLVALGGEGASPTVRLARPASDAEALRWVLVPERADS